MMHPHSKRDIYISGGSGCKVNSSKLIQAEKSFVGNKWEAFIPSNMTELVLEHIIQLINIYFGCFVYPGNINLTLLMLLWLCSHFTFTTYSCELFFKMAAIYCLKCGIFSFSKDIVWRIYCKVSCSRTCFQWFLRRKCFSVNFPWPHFRVENRNSLDILVNFHMWICATTVAPVV